MSKDRCIKRLGVLLATLPVVVILNFAAFAQTTTFTYQGKLTDTGNPPTDTYQMEFSLFDAVSGGTQIGATIPNNSVAVAQGIFTVRLDFGAALVPGADRFLQIAVRRNAGEAFVTLNPRQQISSSPYSIRTLSAAQADLALDSNKLGGVNASEYVTNSTAGSSFIRNGTTLQTGNFNISGNGLLGGSVGIGTTTPSPFYKLDVVGPIQSRRGDSTHVVADTFGGTNSWARFYMRSSNPSGTLNQSWLMGTSQNFNGNQFYLADETGNQSRMTIQPFGGAISFPFGNVGIGTNTPNAALELRGTGLQQRITDNASGNSLVLQGGAGSNMKVTGYNYGTNAGVPLYLSVDGANTILNSGGGNVGIGTTTPNAKLTVIGNTTQDSNSFGMPKAMLFVLANGTISRCYNGITGASTPASCGFSVTFQNQIYTINLGFSTSQRFFSLTSHGTFSINTAQNISGRIYEPSGTGVKAEFWETGNTNTHIPSDFFLIVY